MASTNDPRIPARSRHFDGAPPVGVKPLCPRCGSSVFRIRRRALDRILSSIVPVHRYRCCAEKDLHCDWEGVLQPQNMEEKKPVYHIPGSEPATEHRARWKIGKFLENLVRPGAVENELRVNELPVEAFVDVSFRDMAQITLDAIGDAVLVVDPEGNVIYLNKVAQEMTGWSSEQALGRPVEEVFFIVDGSSRKRKESPSQRAINEGRIVELTLGSVLIRRNGTGIAIEDSAAPILNRHGKVAGAVVVFHDALQSKFEIQKMNHLAHHDFLTGLPNRMLLMEQVAQAIGMAKRHSKQVALLFLDLDRFKQVNDSFGHAVGDDLLQEVAEDIVDCVRTTDTVSRHGGDEFVILLSEIEEVPDAARVAEKLLARFASPRIVDGHEIDVSLSIGISVYPENGNNADTLLRNADAAMYRAKASGRNSHEFCL